MQGDDGLAEHLQVELSMVLIREGGIPKKALDDALHAAIAAVQGAAPDHHSAAIHGDRRA